jgi:hypothetical protein
MQRRGILEGRFGDYCGAKIYKFISKGKICYIEMTGSEEPAQNKDSWFTIKVYYKGSFGGFDFYRLIRFLDYKKYKFTQHRLTQEVKKESKEELQEGKVCFASKNNYDRTRKTKPRVLQGAKKMQRRVISVIGKKCAPTK